ncbi:GNAT family N-acetyltransferase [Solibacillus daqui]|uniref:GNAT family N-acetyltransferase n=1 Tax=Solibacillus daqui TaxID=2912187 RepID=UPI0023664899|nr:GNAT family N-acetyltransferase [Solibacillus daqui]
MNLHFELINPENWRIFSSLKVKREQEDWVASNITILARAYVYREYKSIAYAIYDSNTPIGLLLQRDFIDNGKRCCVLDQFMIDEQFQGKGYGKKAMQLWISLIKKDINYDSIILCYKEEDFIACKLYQSLGFQHTGEVDEDEVIMEYKMFN